MKIKTFKGELCKQFHLSHFIKIETLPASITNNVKAGPIFLINATTTYIGLMNLSEHMEIVNVGFPKCLESTDGLERFIQSVILSLKTAGVKSIRNLYLPQITLRDEDGTDLIVVCEELSKASFQINFIHFPVSIAKMPYFPLTFKGLPEVDKVTIYCSCSELDDLIWGLNQSRNYFESSNADIQCGTDGNQHDVEVPEEKGMGSSEQLALSGKLPEEDVSPFTLERSLNTCDSSSPAFASKAKEVRMMTIT